MKKTLLIGLAAVLVLCAVLIGCAPSQPAQTQEATEEPAATQEAEPEEPVTTQEAEKEPASETGSILEGTKWETDIPGDVNMYYALEFGPDGKATEYWSDAQNEAAYEEDGNGVKVHLNGNTLLATIDGDKMQVFGVEGVDDDTEVILDKVDNGPYTLKEGFTSEPVPEDVQQRMLGKSYPEDCDVPFEDLRYLRMDYYGFDGQDHEGEMVVNAVISDMVLEVFAGLYEAQYPIEKMVLVDEYDAVDEASMTDNNTSAFCFRTIEGSNARSFHSDGLAIDLNPLYNPYVRDDYVEPAAAKQYVDRTTGNPYYIDADSLPTKLFKERGFTWGGDWETKKDYQHFAYGE